MLAIDSSDDCECDNATGTSDHMFVITWFCRSDQHIRYTSAMTAGDHMAHRGADSFHCTRGMGAGLDQVVIRVVGGVASPRERNLCDQLHGHTHRCGLSLVAMQV